MQGGDIWLHKGLDNNITREYRVSCFQNNLSPLRVQGLGFSTQRAFLENIKSIVVVAQHRLRDR